MKVIKCFGVALFGLILLAGIEELNEWLLRVLGN